MVELSQDYIMYIKKKRKKKEGNKRKKKMGCNYFCYAKEREQILPK